MKNLRKKFPGKAVVDIRLGFPKGDNMRIEGWMPEKTVDVIALLCAKGPNLNAEERELRDTLYAALMRGK